MVSMFRTGFDLWPGDAAFASLTTRVERGCPEFALWWATHRIATPVSGTKRLYHPTRGVLCFDYSTFQSNDDPGLKLALYTRR